MIVWVHVKLKSDNALSPQLKKLNLFLGTPSPLRAQPRPYPSQWRSPASDLKEGGILGFDIMRIAIVGGGFSGTAVAINILRRSVDDILLTLFERGETVGKRCH